jgi:hypothetical protein
MSGFKQAQFNNFGIRTDRFQILNRTATLVELGQINNFPFYYSYGRRDGGREVPTVWGSHSTLTICRWCCLFGVVADIVLLLLKLLLIHSMINEYHSSSSLLVTGSYTLHLLSPGSWWLLSSGLWWARWHFIYY